MKSGYWGFAIYQPKNSLNVGTLWRTCHILGASFLATIGRRYKHQPSDTTKAWRHLPLFSFETFDEFRKKLPFGCQIVGLELHPRGTTLKDFPHPRQAVYLLGAEDHGIPESVLDQCNHIVRLDGERSMNVAVAGSIVAYHREAL